MFLKSKLDIFKNKLIRTYSKNNEIKTLTRDEIKIELAKEPVAVDINELDNSTFGRLQLLVDGVCFETFLANSKEKKLFVCLSDAGTNIYPRFQRASWISTFKGLFLCIDDPSKSSAPIPLTYYFGTKNISYLDLIIKIVQKVSKLHSIRVEDIIFIGSSMAGFSALYCCDNLKGSKSIVFNPQFFIQKWLSSRTFFTDKDFERCFDFSFADPQFFYRTDLRRITENKKSRFFIFLNTNSAQDKLQIDELARVSGFKYRTGIQKIGNIMLYIAPFNAPHPHQAFPIEQTCRIFLNSLYNFNLTNFEKDVYFAFTSMYAWHFRKLMDTNNKKIC